MTTVEMRDKLTKFCHEHDTCKDCPLERVKSGCRCGCGTHFKSTDPTTREYGMTTDEIIKAYNIVFPENKDNPYWENITKIAEKQRAKGMETYGQGLEDNDKPALERITYIEEELVDALMYLEWLKEKIKDGR